MINKQFMINTFMLKLDINLKIDNRFQDCLLQFFKNRIFDIFVKDLMTNCYNHISGKFLDRLDRHS